MPEVSTAPFAIVAAVLIAILCGWTWRLARKSDGGRGEFTSWISTVVATIVSTLGAVLIGLWLFGWQERARDEARRINLRTVLMTEVVAFCRQARFDMGIDKDQWQDLLVGYFEPVLIEEAIRSGLFTPEQTTYMVRLSRAVHVYNELSRILASFPDDPDGLHRKTLVLRRRDVVEVSRGLLEAVQAGISEMAQCSSTPLTQQ